MIKKIKKIAVTVGLAGIMAFSLNASVFAGTKAVVPTIARTKAWDSITQSLGGVPESVQKIEYAGSIFYLGEGVTEDDFSAVLAVGPKAVSMQTSNESKLYNYPAYILWSADGTTLLVHPIIFPSDDVLEAVAVSTEPPVNLSESITAELLPSPKPAAFHAEKINVTPIDGLTAEQTVEYMLSDEYADAVRNEFYKLLNEYRASNGLKTLEVNLELQEYADIRAAEQRTLFGHTRPDGTPAGSGWYDSQNNMGSRYAENAAGTGALGTDPAAVATSAFTKWKNSPGHDIHMLYDFNSNITMALGICPEFDEDGWVSSGMIWATGY